MCSLSWFVICIVGSSARLSLTEYGFFSGSIALATQHPWLIDGTIRDNILLGRPFSKSRYLQVLKDCALIGESRSSLSLLSSHFLRFYVFSMQLISNRFPMESLLRLEPGESTFRVSKANASLPLDVAELIASSVMFSCRRSTSAYQHRTNGVWRCRHLPVRRSAECS